MAEPPDFTDDYPGYPDMPSDKVKSRITFIEESMLRFMLRFNGTSRRVNSNSTYVFALDDPGVRHRIHEMSTEIMRGYYDYRELIGHMVAHGSKPPRIDRHKIIAGKQAAVMVAAPLRVVPHAGLTDAALNEWRSRDMNDKPYLHPESVTSEDRPFTETMLLNANFAFSLGVDILCNWNRCQQNARGFIARNNNLHDNYTRLLLNTFVSQSARPTHDCCFFWCSHLWFMLEEKLLASAGRR